MDIIPAIQSSIEIATKLRELSKKVADANFKMLLADLSSSLGDAKLEAANLKAEVAELKNRNLELQTKLDQREAATPELIDGTYMFEGDTKHYCTACFDTKKDKITLSAMSGIWRDFGAWQCPVCDKTFGQSVDAPSDSGS